VLLALALWLTSHFAYVWFAPVQHFRDELILLLLIAVGAFVYAFLILALFGRGWLFALRRV
jgi:putative peptidoglycan lipid II flippase